MHILLIIKSVLTPLIIHFIVNPINILRVGIITSLWIQILKFWETIVTGLDYLLYFGTRPTSLQLLSRKQNTLYQWFSKYGLWFSNLGIYYMSIFLDPTSIPNKSETLGVKPCYLCFNKFTRSFWGTLKFDNHCSRYFM